MFMASYSCKNRTYEELPKSPLKNSLFSPNSFEFLTLVAQIIIPSKNLAQTHYAWKAATIFVHLCQHSCNDNRHESERCFSVNLTLDPFMLLWRISKLVSISGRFESRQSMYFLCLTFHFCLPALWMRIFMYLLIFFRDYTLSHVILCRIL